MLMTALARDPGQDRHRERRRHDPAVLDDEDVLARPVGDVPLVVEHDRLVVAGALGLVDGEHRIEVDPGRLGRMRDRVRPDALPGGDLRADADGGVLVAEVVPPRPAHDHDLDRVPLRVHAELPVAVERERADVTLGQPVAADQLVRGGAELVDGERELHVEELGRVLQPLQVLLEAEDSRAVRSLVATDALEDTRAVVEPVHADVHLRVGPVDELAVHPDRFCLVHQASPLGPESYV